jgi:hypothetical protein
MYVVRDAQEIKPTFRTGVPVIPVPAGKQNDGTEKDENQNNPTHY